MTSRWPPRRVLAVIVVLALALTVTGCGVSARQWAAQQRMGRLVRGLSHRPPGRVHCSATPDGATCTAFAGGRRYDCDLSTGGPVTGALCFYIYRGGRPRVRGR